MAVFDPPWGVVVSARSSILFSLPVLAILTSILAGIVVAYCAGGVDLDAVGVVRRVVDGDTLDVLVLKAYDPRYQVFVGHVIRVRLADIDAPELYTSMGRLAKYALQGLVYGRQVYLDIDDIYVTGKYGRVIAVLYLPTDNNTLLNVNLWLVEKGYAVFKNYPNEFNPYTWNLYVTIMPTTPTTTLGVPQKATATKTVTITRTHTVERCYTLTITVQRTVTVTVHHTKTTTTTLPVTVTLIRTTTTTIYKLSQQEVPALLLLTASIALMFGYKLGKRQSHTSKPHTPAP